MSEFSQPALFELEDVFSQEFLDERKRSAAETILSLVDLTMRFSRVERVPRYDEESRESDVEHSFMLAIVATEIAKKFYPDYDLGLIAQFSLVHDLSELETPSGDVSTYIISETDLAIKKHNDEIATHKLLQKLPPHTAEMLERYEQQKEPEARLVRHIDKALPTAVDILGAGKKVLAEDYGVTEKSDVADNDAKLINRNRAMFPEPEQNIVHQIREVLGEQFTDTY